MLTVLEIITKTTEFFAAKGIESPRLNAELLIGHSLGLERMQLYLQFERLLPEAELEKIRPLVRRRAQHEPVQYILGETDFHGLKLKVDRRALIPRPETEQLVEHIVGAFGAGPPARILDLGAGSGAIALALARAFPNAGILATDVSADALALARENAERVGLGDRVELVQSDWFTSVPPEPFDLVVSNPPYLSAAETAESPVEVREFEPRHALTSADDGIADLARIVAEAPGFLSADGLLALETGIGHHAELILAAQAAGFSRVESRRDLAGRDRFLLVRR